MRANMRYVGYPGFIGGRCVELPLQSVGSNDTGHTASVTRAPITHLCPQTRCSH